MADDELLDDEGSSRSNLNPLEIARYVLQAARRHWILGLVLGLVIVSLGSTVAVLLPPKYEARSRVFVADADSVAPIEGKSDRLDPTKGVAEKVLRDENLRAIVREAKLDELWEAQRPPILRLKDRLRGSLSDYPKDLRIKILAGTLAERLSIYIENGTTIHFIAQWGDPETAANIVNIARHRFLEERLQEEVAVLTAAIDLLEKEVEQAAEAIEPRLKAVDAAYQDAVDAARRASAPKAEDGEKSMVVYRKATSGAAKPDPSIAQKLGEIRQSIRQTKEPWERQTAELKAKLSELRTIYGPEHPAVLAQKRRIEAASAPPPELAELKAKERELLGSIGQPYGADDDSGAKTVRVRVSQPSAAPTPALPPEQVHDSATISTERSKLLASIQNYSSLTTRLDTTRLELTTAQTAFKYRYAVLEEAEPPPGPTKPKLPMLIVLGSIVFGALLGMVAGAARELATGRLLDIWQVRQLGLPVLAQIDFPTPPTLKRG